MSAASPVSKPGTVTILLGTFNGARYLEAQLQSYTGQSHRDWRLWVSDDGSKDGTRQILARFQQAQPRRDIRIFDGPNAGLAANYLSLLHHPDLPPGPVALSDQDDVWLPQRLHRALAQISAVQGPVCYASRTIIADAQLWPCRMSRAFPVSPGFGNTLLQNYMSGNTIVLSQGAMDIVRAAGTPKHIPYHDWWLAQLLSGAGAHLIYDHKPGVYYRQHPGNAMGVSAGACGFIRRLKLVFSCEYRGWLRANSDALLVAKHLLLPENRAILQQFCARNLPRWRSIAALRKAGVHRQVPLHTLVFYLARMWSRR